MKKQFLIFTTLTTIVFMSCSKEQIEELQTDQPEESATAMNNTSQQRGGSLINTVDRDLLARFEFDGNLKDMTGKVPAGTPRFGRPVYTSDRKGKKNSAIRFDETYGVDLWDVPLDTNMSISFWMKYDITPTIVSIPVVEGSHTFSFLHRENNRFQCGYWDFYNPSTILSRPLFNGWHHMAATRDNKTFKFYIDGVLVNTVALITGGPSGKTYSEYVIGYGMNAGYRMWKGDIDDLRIYKKVMAATEISTLTNL